ncbi:hypothetical protein [Desulfurivibrio alkaliphilus]|uniref:O-antigen ligase domain-containing protein n=1 Tax=Desulfurivibrio alkaliphilus (strain DSM 19089 / UNIQEM U267 / AHT2) TaxID=589865 RepID=D6Z4J1_DESAT|nr:hypothetical protein [Desulfurivibrio alkaliphilus]ADH86466.1 conserved hypothetical protein [Desulfurivibrio alkaliphilus AHT 2]
MTPLVPIMLFGWVPFTVMLFFTLKPHRAVLVAVIGGWLLLPATGYSWEGIPPYNKNVAISMGLILGGWLSGQYFKANFKWRIYDLPMVLWCLAPIPTSLTNQLGLYDGLSGFYSQIMTWGIPYLAGRIYFKNNETLRDLCLAVVIGGFVYAILALYEIRMSPQLSNMVYGFFPHSFLQHFRYDGFRPIVFMQHGLMVSLWIALSATVAFWLWRSRAVERLGGIPMAFIVAVLVITTILCKSANAWVALALGCGGYFVYRKPGLHFIFPLLLLVVPLYIGLRISGMVAAGDVEVLVAKVFDEDRTSSLAIRLLQEDLFSQKALESPLFGWGGYGRGWPVDPDTGRNVIQMVDAFWTIVFNSRGFFGLISMVVAMLLGPWLVLCGKALKRGVDVTEIITPVILSMVVILFMLDSLFNAMVNPVYLMTSGALLGWYLSLEGVVVGNKDKKYGRKIEREAIEPRFGRVSRHVHLMRRCQ